MKKEDIGIKKFYDDVVQIDENILYENEDLNDALAKFISILPASAKILDLGCGTGQDSIKLSKQKIKVTGVDFSEKSIEIAQSKGSTCQFEVMDIRYTDIDLGKFDGILAIKSLIHLKQNEIDLVFNCIDSFLKEDGYVMIVYAQRIDKSEEILKAVVGTKVYSCPVYFHSKEEIVDCAKMFDLNLYEEWELPKSQNNNNYKCLVFKK